MSAKTLRLILGDQLDVEHSWFKHKDQTVTYLVAELHQETRYVITCQNNAWMDSAGIDMWCDVQFGPLAKAKRGKALMIWDNCGPPKVEAVRQKLHHGVSRLKSFLLR